MDNNVDQPTILNISLKLAHKGRVIYPVPWTKGADVKCYPILLN
jgi:hypothetical protein